jgi:mRNA-degrading endonuclease RelE of RelBE toxin-antitoxin system
VNGPSAPGYRIAFITEARDDVAALDGSVRKRLKKVLEDRLAADPEAHGLPLRAPLTNFWKHQFGSHRIIYRIYREERLVVICAVGKRRAGDIADVYRRFEPLVEAGRVAQQIRQLLKDLKK